jgi:hypothetical protein
MHYIIDTPKHLPPLSFFEMTHDPVFYEVRSSAGTSEKNKSNAASSCTPPYCSIRSTEQICQFDPFIKSDTCACLIEETSCRAQGLLTTETALANKPTLARRRMPSCTLCPAAVVCLPRFDRETPRLSTPCDLTLDLQSARATLRARVKILLLRGLHHVRIRHSPALSWPVCLLCRDGETCVRATSRARVKILLLRGLHRVRIRHSPALSWPVCLLCRDRETCVYS